MVRLRWARPRPLALVALIAGVAVAVLIPSGSAGAFGPIERDPAPDSVTEELPEALRLTFDEPLLLRRGAHDVALFTAERERINPRNAEISGYSPRTILVRLEPGAAVEGDITVVWTVLSGVSGERSEGNFSFSVEPGHVAPAPAPPAAAVAAGERSSESIVIWTIVIIVASALFAGALYLLRRASGVARSSVEGVDEGGPHEQTAEDAAPGSTGSP